MKISRDNTLILIIISVHLILTLALSSVLNIRIDERFTLETTGKGPGYALKQSILLEQQAPFYFVLLSLWRLLNGSILFSRLFSVLCIAMTLLAIRKVSRYLIPSIRPPCIVAIFAFNPFMIWATTEIRLYAIGVLLSSLVLLFFFRIYILEHQSRFLQVFYFLTITLALATQYYFVFVFASLAVVLCVDRRWDLLKHFCITHALSLILLLPLLQYIPQQMNYHLWTIKKIPNLFFTLKVVGGDFRDLLFPFLHSFPMIFSILVFGPIALFAIASLAKKPQLMRRTHRSLWTILFMLFIFYLIIARYSGTYFSRSRYLFPVLIVMIFSCYALVDFFREERKARVMFVSTTVILLLYMPVLIRDYWPLAKAGDYIRVSAFIKKFEKPHQPIFVFTPEAEIVLSYYYDGINRIIPVPDKIEYSDFAMHRNRIRDETQLDEIMSKNLAGAEGFWFLRAGDLEYLDVDYNVEVLNKYLDAHFENKMSKLFYEARLDFYKKK